MFAGGLFSIGTVGEVSQWQFRRTFAAALLVADCTLNGEKKCGILPFFSPLSLSELPLAKPSHLAIESNTTVKQSCSELAAKSFHYAIENMITIIMKHLPASLERSRRLCRQYSLTLTGINYYRENDENVYR